MTSVATRVKQVSANGAYFVNLGDVRVALLQNYGTYSDNNPAYAAGVGATLSTATWAGVGNANNTLQSSFSSVLTTSGAAFFRDMGANIVSSGRVFRKVQLVSPRGASVTAGGVGGPAPGNSSDYLSAYIELPGLAGVTSGVSPAAFARIG
jgi:hypothetical protein